MNATNKNPVVITTQALTQASTTSIIQNVGFVSAEETNIVPTVAVDENSLPIVQKVTANDFLDFFVDPDSDLAVKIKSFFAQNPNGFACIIETGNDAFPCSILNNYVDEGDNEVSWYVLSNRTASGGAGVPVNELEVLNLLSQKLADDGWRQKLLMEFDFTNLGNDVIAGFENIKGTGGALVCAANSIVNTPVVANLPYNLVGLFAGEIASPRMTISATNANRAMQYREFLTRNPKTKIISNSAGDFYVENFILYADLPRVNSGASGWFVNAYFQHGVPFDAVWGSVNVNERVDMALTLMIRNSANVQGAELPYSQIGIDKLGSKIAQVLENSIKQGLINQFYANYNAIDNIGVNAGIIAIVPYSTYIKNNPDHKALGLYTGFSYYMDSAGFISKLEINAGLII